MSVPEIKSAAEMKEEKIAKLTDHFDFKGSAFGIASLSGTTYWVYKPYLAETKNAGDFEAGPAILTTDEFDAAYARANGLARAAANVNNMAKKQAEFEKFKAEIQGQIQEQPAPVPSDELI